MIGLASLRVAIYSEVSSDSLAITNWKNSDFMTVVSSWVQLQGGKTCRYLVGEIVFLRETIIQ